MRRNEEGFDNPNLKGSTYCGQGLIRSPESPSLLSRGYRKHSSKAPELGGQEGLPASLNKVTAWPERCRQGDPHVVREK